MVIDGTRYGMFLLLLTGLPLLLAARPILQIWVGPVYAERAAILLRLLVIANVLRLSATPYIVTLIGTGQQRLVVLAPVLEGATNLSISLLAGYYWGAVGVAFGTLCGAIVGVAGNFLYNMRRTTEVQFSIREYVLESLLRPILCVVPLGLALLAQTNMSDPPVTVRVLLMLLGGTVTACCFWRWGLIGTDRQRILGLSRLSSL